MAGIKLFSCILIILFTIRLTAQDESALKRHFEGKKVTLKIDMPATKDGVDIHPYKANPMDYADYSQRIKNHGISIYSGDQIMITTIKQKKKHIEFHLGGGGYGTFSDEKATVDKPYLSETDEEKELKSKIKEEKDKSKKSSLERELRNLQKSRRIEQQKINMEAEQLKASKEEAIRQKAYESGSRFNIRYDVKISSDQLSIESIQEALDAYVDFKNNSPSTVNGNSEIYKGMLWEDVAAIYGAPSNIDQRQEGSLKVMQCTYEKGNQIVNAEFVEGVLIKFTTELK